MKKDLKYYQNMRNTSFVFSIVIALILAMIFLINNKLFVINETSNLFLFCGYMILTVHFIFDIRWYYSLMKINQIKNNTHDKTTNN